MRNLSLKLKETSSTYILKDEIGKTVAYVAKQFPDAAEHAAEIQKRTNAHVGLVDALLVHHKHCVRTQPGYHEHGDDALAYRATRIALLNAGLKEGDLR